MVRQPAERVGPFLVGRLRDSPDYRHRVEAAAMLGISVKRFDGWEPATVYEYDRGRLVRSVPEQEWDEQQQAHMLALVQYRALQCPGCGGHLPDTTDVEADDGYTAAAITCHACVARDIAAKTYAEDPHPSALLFTTKRR